MALHKKGKKPPNPDPESYIWIDTKEGGFWRRKRGLIKKARLNAAYLQSSEYTKICSPAASRIVRKLRPFMEGLQPGRITVRICGKLRKALTETSKLSINCLTGVDLQPEYPINNLLKEDVRIERQAHALVISIPITRNTIKRLNKLVTNYWFELILLYGKADKENSLRTKMEESPMYEIEKDYNDHHKFNIALPEQPWIALLKISCIEGNELAMHPKLYGMKVVAVG